MAFEKCSYFNMVFNFSCGFFLNCKATNLSSNVIFCTATVVLNSSVGMRQACPGEMVTYTCTVNQGFFLDWIVEPFALGSTPLGSSVDCNAVSPPQCDNYDFVATFTNTANPTTVQGGTLADMTSTLTITATVRLNGTVVQCRGTTAVGFPVVNNTLHVAGAAIMH